MQLQVVQRRCKTTRFRAWNSFHRLHTMISTRLRFNGDMRREKRGWVLNGLTVNSFWFRWFRWSCVKSTFNNLWLKSWTLAFGVRIEKSWKIHWWFREKLAEVWKKHQVPKHISLKIVIDHGKYSKKVVVRKSLFWSNWYELILFDIFWRYPELTQAHRHAHTHTLFIHVYPLYIFTIIYTYNLPPSTACINLAHTLCLNRTFWCGTGYSLWTVSNGRMMWDSVRCFC